VFVYISELTAAPKGLPRSVEDGKPSESLVVT
jgi:hypothetical protein